MLVWMDLEMTGLDPARHVIVEIATLVTDDELEIVAEGPDLVVHQPPRPWRAWSRSWSRCTRPAACSTAIAASTITLEEAGPGHPRVHPGARPRGPHRARCAATPSAPTGASWPCYLPEIEEHLHYRSVDVSTIKELTRRWYPGRLEAVPRKATAHRALDDIRESIDELRWYRANVFKPPVDPAG